MSVQENERQREIRSFRMLFFKCKYCEPIHYNYIFTLLILGIKSRTICLTRPLHN